MLKEQLGKNIKYLRNQWGLSQEMAAELCDISEKYWGMIERVEVSASIDIIEKIANGMQIKVGILLQEEMEELGGSWLAGRHPSPYPSSTHAIK